MAKAKQPVTVGGIEFDALIEESRTLEATIPEYSVEDGFSVSDAIILSPENLEMTLYVTNTPVTWYSRHGGDQSRVDSIIKQLEELYYAEEPVTVITSDATYTDMAIKSLTISKSLETGYAREIPISFRKIRVTKAKTTTIPSSYGKSGATAASAGTANTTQSSTSSSTSTSTSTATSSSGSSTSESTGSNASILYSVATSMGLISTGSKSSSSGSSKAASVLNEGATM